MFELQTVALSYNNMHLNTRLSMKMKTSAVVVMLVVMSAVILIKHFEDFLLKRTDDIKGFK